MSASRRGIRSFFPRGNIPFRSTSLCSLRRQYRSGTIIAGPHNSNDSSIVVGTHGVSEKLAMNDDEPLMAATRELGYNPKDAVIWLVEYLHNVGGFEYWASIIGVTFALRFFMLPLAIKTQKNTVAMACVRPEAETIQNAYKRHPNYETDHQLKIQMTEEMKAVWRKYDVNPFRALALPAVQLPIFISFFLAMRDMPQIYPGMSTGGVFWFTDLAVADQTMILPALNGLSFLAMVEMGSDGMAVNQASTMKIVMRVLAIFMIPATMHFNSGLFVYWGANNLISIVQTGFMKITLVREALGIPKMPIPDITPQMKLADSLNPIKLYVDKLKKMTEEKDARVEIIDGVRRPSISPPDPVVNRNNEYNFSLCETKPLIFSSAKDKSKKKK